MNILPRASLLRPLPSLAAAACTALVAAFALAQTPAPSGSSTAETGSGTGSGTDAAAESPGVALDAYAWPAEASAEPGDAEYDTGTLLAIPDNPFSTSAAKTAFRAKICTARAVREWVRITCEPTDPDTTFGVIWGVAGDFSAVKGKMPLKGDLMTTKTPPQNPMEETSRKMAGKASIIFQAKPGTTFLASVADMGFDVGGWGDVSMFVRPSISLDVSWAAGEKAPSIQLYKLF